MSMWIFPPLVLYGVWCVYEQVLTLQWVYWSRYSLSLGMSLSLSLSLPSPFCRISFVMAQTYPTDVLKCRGPRADNPASAGAAGCSSQKGTIWYLIQPDSTMPFVSSLLMTDSIYRHLKFEYNQIEITQNSAPGVADCLKRPCF